MVPPCVTVADVGTDHGYLGIHLLQSGKCAHVIAADLREKPLASARANAERYGIPTAATLETYALRKAFPRTCNPYYEQGKWYKYLFYPKASCVYDGEKGDGSVPTSRWDIDFKGKYDIQTDEGPIVFLKMWRKDALEQFIEKAQAMELFRGKLSVIPE